MRFPFLDHVSDLSRWAPEHPWDTVLQETPEFVVVPSRGSLVPGWVLILPKQRALCLGNLARRAIDELDRLRMFWRSKLAAAFGTSVVAWENGPCTIGASIGCGVDHAHLHLVPLDIDLLGRIQSIADIPIHWMPAPTMHVARDWAGASRPYLLVQETNGALWITDASGFPSQLVRRAIALHVGCDSRFDWKQFDGEEHVCSTLERLQLTLE